MPKLKGPIISTETATLDGLREVNHSPLQICSLAVDYEGFVLLGAADVMPLDEVCYAASMTTFESAIILALGLNTTITASFGVRFAPFAPFIPPASIALATGDE